MKHNYTAQKASILFKFLNFLVVCVLISGEIILNIVVFASLHLVFFTVQDLKHMYFLYMRCLYQHYRALLSCDLLYWWLITGPLEVKKMENKTAIAKKTLTLTCHVSGFPVDHITWSKGWLALIKVYGFLIFGLLVLILPLWIQIFQEPNIIVTLLDLWGSFGCLETIKNCQKQKSKNLAYSDAVVWKMEIFQNVCCIPDYKYPFCSILGIKTVFTYVAHFI